MTSQNYLFVIATILLCLSLHVPSAKSQDKNKIAEDKLGAASNDAKELVKFFEGKIKGKIDPSTAPFYLCVDMFKDASMLLVPKELGHGYTIASMPVAREHSVTCEALLRKNNLADAETSKKLENYRSLYEAAFAAVRTIEGNST